MVEKKRTLKTGVKATAQPQKGPAGASDDVKPAPRSRFASSLAGLANAAPGPVFKPTSPPSAPERIVFTQEQEKFLASNSPHILLSALAGAGKTACLFEYARRRPHQKWNYLVLNRSLSEKLSSQAPKNIKVQTLHQVAFASHGYLLSHKIQESPISRPAIEKALSGVVALAPGLSEALRQGLESYLSSSDLSPGVIHAPLVWQADPNWDPHIWVRALEHLWQSSLDPDNPLPISHAVYLKRYCQQDLPWLSPRWMLDEAQDWPDAVLSAFRKCATLSIRAGDPCQRLYAFRGASLGKWHDPEHEREFRLSQSHRSSHALAPFINAALDRIPGSWVWKGREDLDCLIQVRDHHAQECDIVSFSPSVILADRWKPLEQIRANLKGLAQVHRRPPDQDFSSQGMEISTIHAAKGREFDRVWVADDTIRVGLSPALRSRLAYVALSRARKAISFPRSLLPSPSAPVSTPDLDFIDFFTQE